MKVHMVSYTRKRGIQSFGTLPRTPSRYADILQRRTVGSITAVSNNSTRFMM